VLKRLSNNTIVVKSAFFVRFLSPGSAKNRQWVRWETKQSFDGQLYPNYSYQNLLKLDHFSSSYDEKNLLCFFMPHMYNARSL